MTHVRPARGRLAAAVAAAVLAVLGVILGPTSATAAQPTLDPGNTPADGPLTVPSEVAGRVPGQFIAKLYTEGLGRLPYQTEWTAASRIFIDGGCGPQTLAEVGQQVYTSADYARLGYDNVSRLLTLYRGTWNTEPDAAGLDRWRSGLDHGEAWSTVVARFFVADRFIDLVPRICAGATDASATSYGLAGQQPAAVPTGSAGFDGTEEQLQSLLDDTRPGGIVQLAQRALITLTRPLTVPRGVVLTTTGSPDTAHYAQMGRLVRGGSFDAPMVEVAGGASLTGVWVDGGRNSAGNFQPDRHDIRVLGGRDTTVSGNKVSNTAGSAGVEVLGQGSGHPCQGVSVSGNLITAYSNDHYLTRQLGNGHTAGAWSNGITVGCADTTVTGNRIVDTGGAGITLYPGTEIPQDRVPQRSRIVANTVLSAGVPMYAGIVADPQFYLPGRDGARSYSYRGATISRNVIWSAPDTHFVIGISAGTRPWYAGAAVVGPNSGYGLTISDNRTGPVGARVRTGIAISGLRGVHLTLGDATWLHDDVPGKPGNPCPAADLALADHAATANGRPVDVDYTVDNLDGCMGEP